MHCEIYIVVHALFYKNKLYKNTPAEICPKLKTSFRTINRLKFWTDKFKNLFNPGTQIEICMYTKTWKSDKQARDVRGRCIEEFQIFSRTARWNNSKSAFYCSGQLSPLFRKYQEIRTI